MNRTATRDDSKAEQQTPSDAELKKSIDNTKKEMLKAAKDMDFLCAAKLRDEMFALEKMMTEKF